MVIKNRKLIGLIAFLVGLAIILFWGSISYKIISLPFMGKTAQAKVIGYKPKRGYGVKMVEIPTFSSAKSPFFSFITTNGDTVKTYSNAPQIFILINYEVGEEIKIAYPINEPQKAVIINWKELPGLVLMLAFGILLLFFGKDYLFKKLSKS